MVFGVDRLGVADLQWHQRGGSIEEICMVSVCVQGKQPTRPGPKSTSENPSAGVFFFLNSSSI
jgi:hypothetical protein